MMNSGDIVTVMATNGAEYVGKLKFDEGLESENVTLLDPRFVTMTEKGMGFANGIAATGVKDPKEVMLRGVLFVTETNDEVASAYRTSISGIITPPAGKLQI
jgi:hypothetical protein